MTIWLDCLFEMETKIVFFGQSGVGKTTFARKIEGDDIEGKIEPTLGVEITLGSCGKHAFSIWDVGGKYPGHGSGYYAKAAYGFFFAKDATSWSAKDAMVKEFLAKSPKGQVMTIWTGVNPDPYDCDIKVTLKESPAELLNVINTTCFNFIHS